MLTAKFILCRPLTIIRELKKLKVPYEEWYNKVDSEVEIRVDLSGLNKKKKLDLCKTVGLSSSEIKKTDIIILY